MANSLAPAAFNRPSGGSGIQRRWLSISAAAALIFASLLFAGTAWGKAFEVADAGWEGTSELYALAQQELGKEKVQVLATADFEHLGKDDSLLVLHPERGARLQRAVRVPARWRADGRARRPR